MSVGKVRPRKSGYGVVTAEFMQNVAMSSDARFLIAMVSTLPPDWKFYISWLRKHTGWGKDKLQKVMKELENARHLIRHKYGSSTEKESPEERGGFSWEYEFLLEPAEPENPATEIAATEKPAPQNKAIKTRINIKQNNTKKREIQECVEDLAKPKETPDETPSHAHPSSLSLPARKSERGADREKKGTEDSDSSSFDFSGNPTVRVIVNGCKLGAPDKLSKRVKTQVMAILHQAAEEGATLEEIKQVLIVKMEEKHGDVPVLAYVQADFGRLLANVRERIAMFTKLGLSTEEAGSFVFRDRMEKLQQSGKYCGHCNDGWVPQGPHTVRCSCNPAKAVF